MSSFWGTKMELEHFWGKKKQKDRKKRRYDRRKKRKKADKRKNFCSTMYIRK